MTKVPPRTAKVINVSGVDVLVMTEGGNGIVDGGGVEQRYGDLVNAANILKFHIYTEGPSDSRFGEQVAEATKGCRYSICIEEVSVDWNGGRVNGDSEILQSDPPIEYNAGDRAMVLFGLNRPANRDIWVGQSIDKIGRITPNNVDVSGLSDRVCKGSSGEITVSISTKPGLKNEDSIILENNITGEQQSISTDNITDGNQSFTFQYSIPGEVSAGKNKHLFTVTTSGVSSGLNYKWNSDPDPMRIPIKADVGTKPENLELDSIDDVGTVCDGSRVQPDVSAINSGQCTDALGLNIVDENGNIVFSQDSKDIPGGGEPSSESYRVRFKADK